MIAYRYKLQTSFRKQVIIYFLLYFILATCINPLVNGNYFYLKDKPILAFLPNVIYYPGSILASILLFSIIEQVYHFVYQRFIRS